MMYGFKAIQTIEIVEMAFRKKTSDARHIPISITGPDNFWGVDFFPEGHFDHFYGPDGHKTIYIILKKFEWTFIWLFFVVSTVHEL